MLGLFLVPLFTLPRPSWNCLGPGSGQEMAARTEARCLQIISGQSWDQDVKTVASPSQLHSNPASTRGQTFRPGQGPVSCMNDGERIDKQDTSFNNKISSPLLTSQLIKPGRGHKRATLNLTHHYLGMGQASEENLNRLAVYIELFKAIRFPQNIPKNRAELKICQ